MTLELAVFYATENNCFSGPLSAINSVYNMSPYVIDKESMAIIQKNTNQCVYDATFSATYVVTKEHIACLVWP